MEFLANHNLIQYKTALQHQSRVQKDVTHDIRHFLQSINLNSEVLNKKIEALIEEHLLDQDKLIELRDLLLRIISGSLYINKLVDELENSHPGLEKVQFEKVNLKILLKNIVENYQNSHSKGTRVYELNYSANNMLATLCPNKITRIVDNLLSNSTKYTNDGIIIVQVTESFNEWCISVKDSGSGIPPSKLEYIFKRFTSGLSQNPKKGKGIGLSIVQNLVALHQGRIEVSSIPEKRTIFKVFIPNNLPVGQFHVPIDENGSIISKYQEPVGNDYNHT